MNRFDVRGPLALGTAALGLPYGPPDAMRPPPTRAAAVTLIRHAHDRGVRFFDTAPTYGRTEVYLGEALDGRDAVIATKIKLDNLRAAAEHLARSCARVGRRVDLLQVHNLDRSSLNEVFHVAPALEKLDVHLGASVYDEEDAIAAIDSGLFASIQLPHNLVTPTMRNRALPRAIARNVVITARSALLRGVLTPTGRAIEGPLGESVAAICRVVGEERVVEVALRFAAHSRGVGALVLGARDIAEFDAAADAIALGPLSDVLVERLVEAATCQPSAADPRRWS